MFVFLVLVEISDAKIRPIVVETGVFGFYNAGLGRGRSEKEFGLFLYFLCQVEGGGV